eukprot:jgi/Mesen1/2987/ME000176S02019
MSDDWDAEDFEPVLPGVPQEPVKGQWDDEDQEEEVKETRGQEEIVAAKPKAEKKKKKVEDKSNATGTEELLDPIAEKLRRQRLVEEADFKHTKELFGDAALKSLDDVTPKSEAEYMEYAELVASKVTAFEKSYHYMAMLKAFLRKATASMDATMAKELSAVATVITNEKLKLEKEATAGKKKTGAKKKQLIVDKAEDDDYRGGAYADAGDEYDFM